MGNRDFFFKLILQQDKESWAGGARSVDKLANNVSRLIGTAINAAAAYKALQGVVKGANLASESAMLSDSLGVSVKRLEDWKVAAKIAGVSSSELTKSMGALDRKFTEWKNRGKADTGMAVALGQLGLNASDMFDMSADERARVILQAASTMKDTKNAAALVSQLLGGAGEQMYHFMRLSNTSVDRLLERSRRFSLVDDGVAKKGFAFTTELNTTIAALQQLGTFAGATFGANFTDFLKNVNKFFSDNGTSIAKKITGFSNSLAKIGEAIGPFATGTLKVATDALFDLTDALAKLLEGDFEGAGEKIIHLVKSISDELKKVMSGDKNAIDQAKSEAAGQGKGWFGQWWAGMNAWTGTSKVGQLMEKPGAAVIELGKYIIGGGGPSEEELAAAQQQILGMLKKDNPQLGIRGAGGKAKSFSSLPEELQEAIGFFKLSGGDVSPFQPYISDKIKDGIMRPDGRITQVAPDDWVFAARNIGDLAKMFVPQSASTTTYGGSSYTINQTLNIQGAPFAQAAKRAAYEGTSQALKSFSDSSQRLQLMPGLR